MIKKLRKFEISQANDDQIIENMKLSFKKVLGKKM